MTHPVGSLRLAPLSLSVGLTFASAGNAQPTLSPLGLMPNGAAPEATAISLNGSIVAGFGYSADGIAVGYRWSRTGGFDVLEPVSGEPGVQPRAISADASLVGGAAGTLAAIWATGADVELLSPHEFQHYASITGLSASGVVAAGSMGTVGGTSSAFAWTRTMGIQHLAPLPGDDHSSAAAISGDGAVVVGSSGAGSSAHASRWVIGGGVQDIGALPGAPVDFAGATATSGDGSVVAGVSDSAAGLRAFRWTEADGMRALDSLGGFTTATAVSTDGSVIGGASGGHAVLWLPSIGVVDLNEYLPLHGVDLTGWELTEVRAISADGTALLGMGRNQGPDQAWVLTGISVPAPGSTSVCMAGLLAAPLLRPRRRVRLQG